MKHRWLLLAAALAGCPALGETPPQGVPALVPLVVVTGTGRGPGDGDAPLSIAVSTGGPALREQWLKARASKKQALKAQALQPKTLQAEEAKAQQRLETTARESAPAPVYIAGGR